MQSSTPLLPKKQLPGFKNLWDETRVGVANVGSALTGWGRKRRPPTLPSRFVRDKTLVMHGVPIFLHALADFFLPTSHGTPRILSGKFRVYIFLFLSGSRQCQVESWCVLQVRCHNQIETSCESLKHYIVVASPQTKVPRLCDRFEWYE